MSKTRRKPLRSKGRIKVGSDATAAAGASGGRNIVRLASLSLIDQLNTEVLFVEGIGDAVRGLQALQDAACEGVLVLIDAHQERLADIAKLLEGKEGGK